MTYEIGQKVETPFGKGVVTFLSNIGDDEIDSVWVSFKNVPEIEFSINVIKPYRTPHEKLLNMGFKVVDTIIENNIRFSNGITSIYVDSKRNEFFCDKTNLELSRILTEYLEWLEEGK